MTEESPREEDDREARLAALLSVTIGSERSPQQGVDPVPPVPDDHEHHVGRHPRRGVGRTSWMLLVVLLVTGTGLAYTGSRLVRSSTVGNVLSPVVDPTEPGYEALVDPSPTLVLQHDVDGELDSITVLSLATPEGGSGGVLLVPTRTIAFLPLRGDVPVEVAYEPARPQAQADAVGHLLGVGMQEAAIVSDDRWADLVAPVAPITIENPNELSEGDEVRFEAGEIQLAAEDVGAYLRARVEGESDLARLFRHETFWAAWLDAVAEAGTDAAVPGELDIGVGRFVRALASSEREVATLPVEPVTTDEPVDGTTDEPAFLPLEDQLRALVDRLVPLPLSPAPGERARVRILNGTSDTSEASAVAGRLPPAGVSVTLIGNAVELDVEETTIEYAGDDYRDEADAIAEILGVGMVAEDTRPSDAVDITVTLGADHD